MKNLVKFLLFILYATFIFFMPNTPIVLFVFVINIIAMLLTNLTIIDVLKNLFHFLPFILLTGIINCLLGYYIDAIWLSIKLAFVCNITFIYSKSTTVTGFAKTIEFLCSPLKLFHINSEEIRVLVCIALSMIPVLKNEYSEVKTACKAKNIHFNLKNSKIILVKLLLSCFRRVNEIDEALIEKGYDY